MCDCFRVAFFGNCSVRVCRDALLMRGAQLQKYDMVVQSLIEMGVDIVYPVELPPQSSLNLDGKNSFEPIVCKSCLFT